MNADFTAIAGYLIAAAMMIVAFFAWRKAVTLHHLLVEAANRFEAGRKRNIDLENELIKVNERLDHSRESAQRLERTADDLRQKYQASAQSLANIEKLHKDRMKDVDLRTEHLNAQVMAMTQQLTEADQDRQAALREAAQLRSEVTKKLSLQEKDWAAKLAKAENDVKEGQEQLNAARRHISNLEKSKTEVDPLMLKRMKRKISNLEHLLSSMRGLREMAEERNHNWEIALRQLASWVLREHGVDHAADEKSMGALVGTALERIGVQLIDDGEVVSLHQAEGPSNEDAETLVDGLPHQDASGPDAYQTT